VVRPVSPCPPDVAPTIQSIKIIDLSSGGHWPGRRDDATSCVRMVESGRSSGKRLPNEAVAEGSVLFASSYRHFCE
jgi:hypothetical protein